MLTMCGASERAVSARVEGRSFEFSQLFIIFIAQVIKLPCAKTGTRGVSSEFTLLPEVGPEDWNGDVSRRKDNAVREK